VKVIAAKTDTEIQKAATVHSGEERFYIKSRGGRWGRKPKRKSHSSMPPQNRKGVSTEKLHPRGTHQKTAPVEIRRGEGMVRGRKTKIPSNGIRKKVGRFRKTIDAEWESQRGRRWRKGSKVPLN